MLFLCAAILILVIAFFVKKHNASSEVFTRFGVRESTHHLLSTDLGKSEARVKLSRFGINGIADAVFKTTKGKEILVGEFKSRRHRGVVKLYEFYQLMLYMGHMSAQYPDHRVSGCLAYADARVIVVFDKELYDALVGLRYEYWQTVRSKRVSNSTPLHKRMKVSGANKRLKFTAAL